MNKVATLLLCVCFITVLFPQPGYIHPDEFFQSSEIVAGDILHVKHFRAWEFNSSSPIRSVVFPYLLNAPSLYLLRWMNSSSFSGFKISTVKVVMATRLPLAFLNIFGYLATGKLASHFGVEKSLSTTLWCSSYVFWSYFTRTFSNAIESCLLALVFLLTVTPTLSPTSHSRSREESPKKKKKIGNDSDDNEKKSKPEAEKSDSQDVKQFEFSKDNSSSLSGHVDELPIIFSSAFKLKSVFLGILISAGFFNRPTFLLFTFMPLMYWFLSMPYKTGSDRVRLLVTVKVYGLVGAMLAFVTFVTLDTFYYNADFPIILHQVFHSFFDNPFSVETLRKNYEMLFSSLIVTPWNFLNYNIDSTNLAQHGIHPRYTHLLVNMPLLIGPLYVPFVLVSISSLYLGIKKCIKGTHTSAVWLIFMALFPVLGLSIFPHQEPRFLIPLLPVFIVTGAKIVSAMTQGRRVFLFMWFVFNIVLHLVYGYLHQAAVIPVLSIYQQRLSASMSRQAKQTQPVEHMVFYKTYTPPRHLLLLPESRSDVNIHDLAGSQFKVLMKLVRELEREMQKPRVKKRVYVFLPSTVASRFLDHLAESESSVTSSSICPHLSTESLPRFKEFWKKRISFDDFLSDFCLNIVQITAKS